MTIDQIARMPNHDTAQPSKLLDDEEFLIHSMFKDNIHWNLSDMDVEDPSTQDEMQVDLGPMSR